MRVFAVSGSLRASSSSAALIRAARDLAPAGTSVEMFDQLAELPHFSPDLDVDPLPSVVIGLRSAIGRADALMICTPEYAHGMPGSLKNALDWLVSALEPIGKPVLLIGASPSAATHAYAQLAEVLTTMNLHVVDGGRFVFSRSKLDDRGEVIDPVIRDALGAGLVRLAASCELDAGIGERP